MPKNTEGKEIDTFEKAMAYRIANLDKDITDRVFSSNAPYSEGMADGYRYALAIYLECKEDGTI